MTSTSTRRITVIGGGNGGKALAGHLALLGHRITLYNRSEARLAGLHQNPELKLTGVVSGTGRIATVTSDIRKALESAELVMLTVTANAHAELAELCAPHLVDGQILLLNPGRLFGSIEFYRALLTAGLCADITLAETNTLVHTCRNIEAEIVDIICVKPAVRLAAFPATRSDEVLTTLNELLPVFQKASNILETGLNSVGAILHPLPTLLNMGWIETDRTQFMYYYDGITPSVAQLLEELDGERMAVGRKLGLSMISTCQWLNENYGSRGNDLFTALQDTDYYRTIEAPRTLDHRYITDDVPTGLVPIDSLGRKLGVPTPMADMLIRLAGRIHNRDYRADGRTLEHLGLADCSADKIMEIVNESGLNGNHP